MEKKLKQAGHKLTEPRKAIIKILKLSTEPLSAHAIHGKLGSKFDLASVYRNLNLFEELGLVFSEIIKGEKYYYVGQSPHHHITCKICGLIECLPCQHQFKIKNFADVRHNLSLVGICLKCYKN